MPEFIKYKKKDPKSVVREDEYDRATDSEEDEKEIRAQLQKERVAKINTRARINGPIDDRSTVLGFDKDGNAVTGVKQWPVMFSSEANEFNSKRNLEEAKHLNRQHRVDDYKESLARMLKKRLSKDITIRKEE